MIMEVRWHHGKTLEQNNMEIAMLAMKLAIGDRARAAHSLGISGETLDKLLGQMEKDQQIQKTAQAQYDAQRVLANQRIRQPIPSHQHPQWLKDEVVPDLGLSAVGSTATLEPRSESGMSNKVTPTSFRSDPGSKNPAKKSHSKKGA